MILLRKKLLCVPILLGLLLINCSQDNPLSGIEAQYYPTECMEELGAITCYDVRESAITLMYINMVCGIDGEEAERRQRIDDLRNCYEWSNCGLRNDIDQLFQERYEDVCSLYAHN
jgi:hypothetical protein